MFVKHKNACDHFQFGGIIYFEKKYYIPDTKDQDFHVQGKGSHCDKLLLPN